MRPVTDRTQKSDKAVGIRVEMVGTRSGSEGEPSGRDTRAADPIGAEPSGAVQTWAMRTRACGTERRRAWRAIPRALLTAGRVGRWHGTRHGTGRSETGWDGTGHEGIV